MSHERLPNLALSVGEPAGIGPDIVACIAARQINANLVCIADPDVIASRAAALGIELKISEIAPSSTIPAHQPGRLNILPIKTKSLVTPGQLDTSNASYVLECLDIAIELARTGKVGAIVTGPVHKGIINDAGFSFTGHTEYLAKGTESNRPVMMLASGNLRVALVTTHMALRQVPSAIDKNGVTYVIDTVAESLRRYFHIAHPRIAVCGLNPHAGEGGHFGHEDRDIIAPAIAAARTDDVTVLGPMPADTAFVAEIRDSIDAYITMYHDQGLPVIKALGFGEIVNITLGLPIVRTSVDHGTALDRSASGSANPDSLFAALNTAIELCANSRK
jgi:4-hydroxythreonine-4-phosphate dehydrogenase